MAVAIATIRNAARQRETGQNMAVIYGTGHEWVADRRIAKGPPRDDHAGLLQQKAKKKPEKQ